MEIGGFIEFERYSGEMLHEGAIALNYARNALLYLCKAKKIKKIVLPRFLCNSIMTICKENGISYRYYRIGYDLLPENICLDTDEWLYLVNYYGQLSDSQIRNLNVKYKRIIVDNAQAYFQKPINGIDTLYTCRKFFGVSDGAFLYMNKQSFEEVLLQDESHERLHYLLGRFERTATDFYLEYVRNEKKAENEPIKKMSKLTDNLLHAINYKAVKRQRTENFKILYEAFKNVNRLKLTVPKGAFMYPLFIENGAEVRKTLQKKKIYIPILWPDVFDLCSEGELEYDMAVNILPLPCDQRYGEKEMVEIIEEVVKCLNQ